MKKFFSLLITTLSFSFVYAQNMNEVYLSIPDSLSILLTKDNRIELVDNYLNNKEPKIKNKLGGESELKALTDDYMLLQTTSKSTLEAKFLPVNEYYKIICLIQTYCGPACDSKLSFYTTDWKPLKNSFNFNPLYIILNKTECEETHNKLDAITAKYALNQNDLSLTITSTVNEYLGEDLYKDIASCLKKEIVYQWIEGRFQ